MQTLQWFLPENTIYRQIFGLEIFPSWLVFFCYFIYHWSYTLDTKPQDKRMWVTFATTTHLTNSLSSPLSLDKLLKKVTKLITVSKYKQCHLFVLMLSIILTVPEFFHSHLPDIWFQYLTISATGKQFVFQCLSAVILEEDSTGYFLMSLFLMIFSPFYSKTLCFTTKSELLLQYPFYYL